MSGKGSAPRPFSVSDEEYAQRWDAIFAKDKPKEAWEQLPLPLEEPCKHQVWGHQAGSYFCIDCGVTNEAGPYVSR